MWFMDYELCLNYSNLFIDQKSTGTIQIYLLIKKVQEQTNKNELYIYINDMYILIF